VYISNPALLLLQPQTLACPTEKQILRLHSRGYPVPKRRAPENLPVGRPTILDEIGGSTVHADSMDTSTYLPVRNRDQLIGSRIQSNRLFFLQKREDILNNHRCMRLVFRDLFLLIPLDGIASSKNPGVAEDLQRSGHSDVIRFRQGSGHQGNKTCIRFWATTWNLTRYVKFQRKYLSNLSYHQVRDQPSAVSSPHNACVGDVHVRYRVIKDNLDIALLEASRHILAEVCWVCVVKE